MRYRVYEDRRKDDTRAVFNALYIIVNKMICPILDIYAAHIIWRSRYDAASETRWSWCIVRKDLHEWNEKLIACISTLLWYHTWNCHIILQTRNCVGFTITLLNFFFMFFVVIKFSQRYYRQIFTLLWAATASYFAYWNLLLCLVFGYKML